MKQVYMMDRTFSHSSPDAFEPSGLDLHRPNSSEIIRDIRQRTLGRDQLIVAITEHIEEQMPRFPSLEKMADYFCISSRTLSRRLQQANINYRQLTTELKMAYAKEHLLTGATSIDEIAKYLGYQNNSNFTKAFRSWTGSTPHQYRIRKRRSF
ncbi:MAG: AraC family transcriptional regulator [Pseudomonadota bacterium]|nr:AraC family transcriptional regulator [Pseudomonadota bacterium]